MRVVYWHSSSEPYDAYCTCRELFIANGLSRHFSWSHNILFVEDLLNPNACCREAAHTSPHSCSDLTLLTATADAGAGGAGTVGHHHCRHVHIDHTVYTLVFCSQLVAIFAMKA